MQLNPGIHEDVTRATVKAENLCRTMLQQGDIAEAADVEYSQLTGLAAKERLVEGRDQRGALAARGYVAAAEVGNDIDTGQLGEQRRIANLHGKTQRGFVADGLAMAANGADIRRGKLLLPKELLNAFSYQHCPARLGQGAALNFIITGGAEF